MNVDIVSIRGGWCYYRGFPHRNILALHNWRLVLFSARSDVEDLGVLCTVDVAVSSNSWPRIVQIVIGKVAVMVYDNVVNEYMCTEQ